MTQPLDDRFKTKHFVGQHNIQKWGLEIHNPVFVISTLLISFFVIGTLLYPQAAKQLFDQSKSWSIDNFDWLFMLSANVMVVFCIALIILPVGRIRLGGDKATADFSLLSWFSMLFAAGMGIGLMFWSVAEPVAYYTEWYGSPLNVAAGTEQAATLAMGATLFHWGLHPWAIYAVVGLSIAYMTHSRKLPLTLRSTFYPLLGESTWGMPGHIIDVLAVLATLFGLATSLGFGAQQAAGGLHFLFDVSNDIGTQVLIVFCVTAVAVVSVIRGLEGGVKVLSKLNMALAALLLLFVVVAGSTSMIINGMGGTLLAYIDNIIPFSNWIGREDQTFYRGWTVFYWAWWISWSPFVGMFIARISKGRTVRQFIIAVLLVPSVVTLVWMSAFGGSGVEQAQAGIGQLANGITDSSLALFYMLENLPLTQLSSFVAIVLVLVFFVTSSDSGSLVIDSITAGGKLDAPVAQRIFWASMEGIIAAALLYGGGSDALGALQAAAISVGLPFTVVLLVMCVSLYMGLHAETKQGPNR